MPDATDAHAHKNPNHNATLTGTQYRALLDALSDDATQKGMSFVNYTSITRKTIFSERDLSQNKPGTYVVHDVRMPNGDSDLQCYTTSLVTVDKSGERKEETLFSAMVGTQHAMLKLNHESEQLPRINGFIQDVKEKHPSSSQHSRHRFFFMNGSQQQEFKEELAAQFPTGSTYALSFTPAPPPRSKPDWQEKQVVIELAEGAAKPVEAGRIVQMDDNYSRLILNNDHPEYGTIASALQRVKARMPAAKVKPVSAAMQDDLYAYSPLTETTAEDMYRSLMATRWYKDGVKKENAEAKKSQQKPGKDGEFNYLRARRHGHEATVHRAMNEFEEEQQLRAQTHYQVRYQNELDEISKQRPKQKPRPGALTPEEVLEKAHILFGGKTDGQGRG